MTIIGASSDLYVVEYACPAWSTGITKGQSDSLEQIQKRAMYIIAP